MRKTYKWRLLLLLSFSVIASWAYSQTATISGKVRDTNGKTLQSASVSVKGTGRGAPTDENGNFILKAVPLGKQVLVVNYIGYKDVEKTIEVTGDAHVDIELVATATDINEVIVIGYGTARKKDLTGSITTINTKDFQKGAISTADQLMSGKLAGIQITPNGGAPGNGSTIRIRGGSSLNASNDPLIVIDGVPVANGTKSDGTSSVSGSPNPLSLINPNDIESINVLKDASATAIYGNRASNGVIIITTKKGKSGGALHVNFNTVNSISVKTKNLDVLSADQFRQVVTSKGNQAQIDSLGSANTNWQDEIYHAAFGTDNNISLSGGIKSLPYRLSLGYLDQNGILKTGYLRRFSTAINISPSFFAEHLKVDFNVKGAVSYSRFANQNAVGDAIRMDPTKSVYDSASPYGGYYEWQDNGLPNTQSTRNPVADLYLKNDKSTVYRTIGNLQLDYKFHFLPDLHANLNLGYDYTSGSGTVEESPEWAGAYTNGGRYHEYKQRTKNKLLDFYLLYGKDLSAINSHIDVMAGYSYQDFLRGAPGYYTTSITGIGLDTYTKPDSSEYTLLSYYGRLNYSYRNKYLLTATIRRDGSSRFSPDNRWGNFPSVALAWKISEEPFLKGAKSVSNLKLRLGYGVTGQQDITTSDYPYLAVYTISTGTTKYPLGDSSYYMYRGNPYDQNIRWEETSTYNVGLDYGFLNNRITGSVDFYLKKTKDLISDIPTAAGANLSNHVLTNVGNIENKGIEFSINATPVATNKFNWDMSFNLTYNKSEITKLSTVPDPSSPGVVVGGISGGTGNKVQIHSVGYAPYSFWVYKQVYDQAGKPIEGVYTDVNKDPNNLFYRYKSPAPSVIMGFSSSFNYERWNLSFVLRSNLGNYVYNNINSDKGAYSRVLDPNKYLGNVTTDVLYTNFNNNQFYSDYYVENASFLRMDNLQIGYDFGKIISRKVGLKVSAIAQNLFVITKYSGLDPEIFTGIDDKIYPKPRIFSLAANLEF